MYFVPAGVQFLVPSDVAALKSAVGHANVEPAAILVDTFARSFVGGEENSSCDVGLYIDACRQLQQEYPGAAIILVHHTGKGKNDIERGSSALRAGADAMFLLQRTGQDLVLTNDKQKDAEELAPVRLRLMQVDLGEGAEDAETSCVVVSAEAGDRSAPVLSEGHRDLLTALAQSGHSTGSELRDALGMADRTFHRRVGEMIRWGLLQRDARGTYSLTTHELPLPTYCQQRLAAQRTVPTAATATTP